MHHQPAEVGRQPQEDRLPNSQSEPQSSGFPEKLSQIKPFSVIHFHFATLGSPKKTNPATVFTH